MGGGDRRGRGGEGVKKKGWPFVFAGKGVLSLCLCYLLLSPVGDQSDKREGRRKRGWEEQGRTGGCI